MEKVIAFIVPAKIKNHADLNKKSDPGR